jgi:hypothetical protein
MLWILVAASVVLVCFGLVLIVGAPYLPTLTPQVEAALDMLDLKPGQTMLELGCGDGKVLIAAAKRGWHCVGYELKIDQEVEKPVRLVSFAFSIPDKKPTRHENGLFQYDYR